MSNYPPGEEHPNILLKAIFKLFLYAYSILKNTYKKLNGGKIIEHC